MSVIDDWLLLVGIVLLALNLIMSIVQRIDYAQLTRVIIHSGFPRLPDRSTAAEEAALMEANNPLREVFRSYSTLTERMAELVFRLTEPESSAAYDTILRELHTIIRAAQDGVERGDKMSPDLRVRTPGDYSPAARANGDAANIKSSPEYDIKISPGYDQMESRE
jgi:hypothetical protein